MLVRLIIQSPSGTLQIANHLAPDRCTYSFGQPLFQVIVQLSMRLNGLQVDAHAVVPYLLQGLGPKVFGGSLHGKIKKLTITHIDGIALSNIQLVKQGEWVGITKLLPIDVS